MPDKWVERYRKIGLPTLAVLETMATKGASPGTTALTQEQIFRQAEQDQEAARQRAFARRLGEYQMGEFEAKGAAREAAGTRAEAFGRELETLEGLTPEQKAVITAAGPEGYKMAAQFLKPKGKSMEEMMAWFAYQQSEGMRQWRQQQAEAEERKIRETEAGAKRKAKMEVQKKVRERQITFAEGTGLMREMWKRKLMSLTEGGPGDVLKGGGPIKGFLKGLGAKYQVGPELAPSFKATEAFAGQVTETALSYGKMLTGGSRVIESVFGRLAESFPNISDKFGMAAEKMEQSLRNGYALALAAQRAGIVAEAELISEEELDDPNSDFNRRASQIQPAKLTAAENMEATRLIRSVLGYVPSSKEQPPLKMLEEIFGKEGAQRMLREAYGTGAAPDITGQLGKPPAVYDPKKEQRYQEWKRRQGR